MQIRSMDEFLDYWRRIRHRTRRVAELIPPDRVEWTHRQGKFTLGGLVRHLAASERWLFTETVLGRPSRYPGHGPELGRTREEVLSLLDHAHAESVALLGTMTSADLTRRCVTPAGHAITAWKWLRAMVEHEVHHRGQLYLMLGILGVETPPLYGLTVEEVHAASHPPGPRLMQRSLERRSGWRDRKN